MLIDSHCHLTFPELSEQIDAVLDRADAAGVKRIVNICTSSSDAERAVELLGAREQVSFSVGLHRMMPRMESRNCPRFAGW
jgi:TatD DNase family protein